MKLALKLTGGIVVLLVSVIVLILLAQANIVSLILSIALIILLLGGYYFEFKKTKDYEFSLDLLIEVGALIIAGLITYYVSTILNPILAASLTGLVGAMLIFKYKDAIYVGAFAGMSSIFNIYLFLVVLLLVSIIYLLIKNTFNGIGGKGGLTAFLGGFVVYFFLSVNPNVTAFTPLEYLLLIGIAILSSMATYFLSKYLENNVLGSSFIGLIFGIILLFFNDNIIAVTAMVGFGATFIGMQSRYKFYLLPISSILFVFLYSYSYLFIGVGGLLGFLAFLSSVPIIFCQELVNIKREKSAKLS